MGKLDIEGLDGFHILKGLILINFHVQEHNSLTNPFEKQNVVVLFIQIAQNVLICRGMK